MYFLDTELPSYLLRIRAAADLRIHAQYGSIFESYVISELFKNYLNRGEEHPIYFWPDSTGNEIDIVIDEGDRLIPLEIKAGHTVSSDFFKGIRFWKKLSNDIEQPSALVYRGDKSFIRSDTHACDLLTFSRLGITPWRDAVFKHENHEGTKRTFRPDRTMRQH